MSTVTLKLGFFLGQVIAAPTFYFSWIIFRILLLISV